MRAWRRKTWALPRRRGQPVSCQRAPVVSAEGPPWSSRTSVACCPSDPNPHELVPRLPARSNPTSKAPGTLPVREERQARCRSTINSPTSQSRNSKIPAGCLDDGACPEQASISIFSLTSFVCIWFISLCVYTELCRPFFSLPHSHGDLSQPRSFRKASRERQGVWLLFLLSFRMYRVES